MSDGFAHQFPAGDTGGRYRPRSVMPQVPRRDRVAELRCRSTVIAVVTRSEVVTPQGRLALGVGFAVACRCGLVHLISGDKLRSLLTPRTRRAQVIDVRDASAST